MRVFREKKTKKEVALVLRFKSKCNFFYILQSYTTDEQQEVIIACKNIFFFFNSTQYFAALVGNYRYKCAPLIKFKKYFSPNLLNWFYPLFAYGHFLYIFIRRFLCLE